MNTTRTLTGLRQLCGSLRCPTEAELSDRELLARFAEGQESAFAALVRRHGALVLGVCRRVLGNASDAEDAFQATFLALARKAGTGAWRDSVAGFLHEVARRTAVQLRVRKARQAAHERRAAQEAGVQPASDAAVLEALDEEVSRLPWRCREAILRCYHDGQTRQQAARQLGCSLRTLDRRLDEGRHILHQRLTARGTNLAVLLARPAAAVPTALADRATRSALGQAPGKVAVLAAAASGGVSRWTLGLLGLLLVGLAVGAGLALPRQPVRPVLAAGPPGKKAAIAPPPGEDPLPKGAVARLGSARFNHGWGVYSVAFSRDGKILASGGEGGLCLWDAATGRLLHRCFGGRARPVTLSPDGRYVFCCYDGGGICNLFSVKTGKLVHRFTVERGRINCVAFSPKGDILAVGANEKTVRLWDPQTGRQLRVLKGNTATVQALAFRDDGKVLTSGSSDGTFRLWDTRTGKELRCGKWPRMGDSRLTFAPGGTMVAAGGGDGTVRLWDGDTGRGERILVPAAKVPPFGAFWEAVNGLAFSPDGQRLAVGQNHGTIQVLDLETGKVQRRWRAAPLQLMCLSYSPDGKVLATGAARQSTIRMWDPSTGKEIAPEPGHVGSVEHLLFCNDGQHLISCGRDGRLLDWDLATKKCRPLFAGARATSHDRVAVSRDGKLLARAVALATRPPDIHVYDTATGKERHILRRDKDWMRAIAFDAESKRLAAVDCDSREREGTVRLWRLDTGALVWQTPVDVSSLGRSDIYPLAFSPDGKWLAYSPPDGQSGVRLFDAATGKEVRRYTNGDMLITALVWSPDSTHLAISSPGVVLWNVRTGEVTRSWPHLEMNVFRIAFSPDGRLLALTEVDADHQVSADYTVRFWEVATGGEIAKFKSPRALPVGFSPDGRTVATGCDTSILLWDVTGRSPGGKLRRARVTAARFAQLWQKLADSDAAAAHGALWELVAGGQQVLAPLKARLPVPRAPDVRQAERLLAGMDADEFATREKALQEAEKLGLAAEPALRKALRSRPGLEPQRRLEAVVASWLRSSDWLRFQRAVAAVEYIGGEDARALLAALAKGAPGARPTQEAAAALARLVGKSD
jgi:RNA polymerase sigma factor (sigma-70 family)